ncbi:MAG: hypothetical protein IPF50_05725 [Proteobacteria bacterium]|nr:hypothetical protein [Pseudomonadota bacterium]
MIPADCIARVGAAMGDKVTKAQVKEIAEQVDLSGYSRRTASCVRPLRRQVGARGKPPAEEGTDKPATPRHVAMNWAKRLKRVFGIDIEACARCGGKLRVIASIEEPEVIAKILAHLERTAPDQYPSELPLGARAPPQQPSRL